MWGYSGDKDPEEDKKRWALQESKLYEENEAKESLLDTCENCFKCEVVLVSDLGTYKIVSLKLGNTEFKARLPEEQAVPSGSVYVRFPSNWLKVYADEYLVD